MEHTNHYTQKRYPSSTTHAGRAHHLDGNLPQTFWQRVHIDAPLMGGLLLLACVGLLILYSAGNQNTAILLRQALRMGLAFVVMIIVAQIPPRYFYQFAPWLYISTFILLIAVLVIGHIGKGAQRWLNLGLFRFQPSELMKLAMPMMLAWYLKIKALPPNKPVIITTLTLLLIPVLLIAKQPDLGTAILIASAGLSVLFLAGISGRLIAYAFGALAALAPILWHVMHGYQRSRVLTFLNPERDPLGTGYHIIQSKIAIGSGGLLGKGWLAGTQSHLQFLPEHTTDFIYAVCGEEFGFIGSMLLLLIFLSIVARGLYIASVSKDTFTRLLAGSLSLLFFISFFVNIGMVTGILPVVGLPLPLISYGGTSMVTMLAGFGMIMSIHTHRRLLGI